MLASTLTQSEMTHFIAEFMGAWNNHDIERVGSFYSPDYQGVDVGQASVLRGPAAVRDSFETYLRAFPDLYFSAEDAVVQGDRIVLTWMAHATHRGALMNIPPCGRQVEVRGVSVLTITDNKVRQGLCMWDVAGLLRRIGLLPEL